MDDDTAAAVEELRRTGYGRSAAVNELIRRGLTRPAASRRFRQRTSEGHALIDVTNVAEVLDVLDGPARR